MSVTMNFVKSFLPNEPKEATGRGRENGAARFPCMPAPLPACLSVHQRGSLNACLGARSRLSLLQAGVSSKLDMTVWADEVTADIKIRFDRTPQPGPEMLLIDDMKNKYNFKWSGYAENGKWTSDKMAVCAFETQAFRTRIKKACKNLSFYAPDGKDVDIIEFIDAVNAFDPSLLDDDLTELGKSTVPTATPDGKRKKTS